ncbi:MAG: ABC transporter ATP-binding protein [Acidobacteriota bacterium]
MVGGIDPGHVPRPEPTGVESEPAILIRNVTRRFGSLTAVAGLNLAVNRGEIFGLVGPDGAGKTTTLRLICGLLDPSQGEVWVAGFEVAREVTAVKDRIGYMAQRFGLYSDLTVQENMVFYADLFGIEHAVRQDLMSRLLRMTRMEPFRRRQAGRLSGGMKQKLALMCSLLHRPEVLILDEPTNGVDPVSRRDFWVILYQLVKEGLTVCITTAYLDEAERCNRVGLMYQGRLIRCDSPERLRRNMAEPCYELKVSDSRSVREALLSLDGVVSVEPSGGSLHVFLDPTLQSERGLRELLHRRGMPVLEMRPIVPSLEDVFIAEVSKASRETVPA